MTQEETNKAIQSWKRIALAVNDQFNQHSLWKLAETSFGKIDSKNNPFIESLLEWMFTKERLSEKQAYCLAKFAVETNQLS